jgi:hypothetical protein
VTDYYGGFGNKKNFHKDGASTLDMTKNVSFIFHLIFHTMQRCLIGSLPVMKCGVFNMTQKENARACRGKHRIHLG